MLVTAEALAAMRPGSVVVDLASRAVGGNVAGSRPERTVVTDGGVTVIGAGNLPPDMADRRLDGLRPQHRSRCSSLLVVDGRSRIDPTDDVRPVPGGIVVTHGGAVTQPRRRRAAPRRQASEHRAADRPDHRSCSRSWSASR